MLKKCNKQLT